MLAMLFRLLVMTHQDIDAGVGLDALNGCGVGASFVEGHFVWRVMQLDGTWHSCGMRCEF